MAGAKGDVLVRDTGTATQHQVTPSTAGKVLTSNGVNAYPSFQTPGTVHTHVIGAPFTGDGVTTAFVLAHTPTANSVAAYINGVRVSTFTVAVATVTFTAAPANLDEILIDYFY